MIVASIFSWFTTIIVVVYASLTLSYGEEDEVFTHEPVHVVHTVSDKQAAYDILNYW